MSYDYRDDDRYETPSSHMTNALTGFNNAARDLQRARHAQSDAMRNYREAREEQREAEKRAKAAKNQEKGGKKGGWLIVVVVAIIVIILNS